MPDTESSADRDVEAMSQHSSDVQLFRYRGPARIGGRLIPAVHLWEERDLSETGRVLMRDWRGSATVLASDNDDATQPIMKCGQVPIELTVDGKALVAQALVSAVTFNGAEWTVDIAGLGPAPGCE